MDMCYLCKDVIGLIFALLPEQYHDLLQVCREAKELLKSVNIDGWDCLIARGWSIKIQKNKIVWHYKELIHSLGDDPAVIIHGLDMTSYIWYKYGKFHRIGAPAHILVYSGELMFTAYYTNGDLHRDDGPAVTEKSVAEIIWYKNGKIHRDGGPAVIRGRSTQHNAKIIYYKNGVLHREDGPAILTAINGKWKVHWYLNGVMTAGAILPRDNPMILQETRVIWSDIKKYI